MMTMIRTIIIVVMSCMMFPKGFDSSKQVNNHL